MNKHIKELAEQAGMFIVDDQFSSGGRFAEKFAELIIRECIREIEDKFDLCGDEITELNHEALSIISESVLKHFGVEE